MIRAFAGLVVAAIAVVITSSSSPTNAAVWVDTGLDLDPAGNSALELGTIESCRSVASGSTFEVDVWVKGIPPASSQGTDSIVGTSYNLHFDPAVLRATAVNFEDFMIATGDHIPFIWIDGDATDNSSVKDPLPATTGNLRAEFADLSQIYESGNGVMSRVTLEAIGPGTTELILQDDLYDNYPSPSILEIGGNLHFANLVSNAIVVVDGDCSQVTPPPPVNVGSMDLPHPLAQVPTEPPPGEAGVTGSSGSNPGSDPGGDPGSQPTEDPSSPDGGTDETSVAVDAVPDDNEATVLGTIETCASGEVGDTFVVDLVINNVEDLLALEISVGSDPAIVDVVDRDVEFFLNSSEGSQVVDTSEQTPDDTGLYTTGAVDTADPLAPDSGSGVLVRLTLEAREAGSTDISLDPIDANNDGKADRGVFLRNVDGDIIGDTNEDTFFDGPIAGAEILIGEDCADSDAKVVKASGGSSSDDGGGDSDDDDGSDALPFVIAGAIAAGLLALAGAGYLAYRRRAASSDATSTATEEPPPTDPLA